MSKHHRDPIKSLVILALVAAVPIVHGCTSNQEGPEIDPRWEDRAAELGRLTRSDDDPGPFNPDMHVPYSSYDASRRMVTVDVPHAMESGHRITAIYIRDQDGIVIGFHELPTPTGGEEAPSVEFVLHETTTAIVAYAHCNLHDNWMEPALRT